MDFIADFFSAFFGAALTVPTWGTAGPIMAPMLGGMLSGATNSAMHGAGLNGILQATMLGGATGAFGGTLSMAGVPWQAMAAGSAGIAGATGGVKGLEHFAAGFGGSIAGAWTATTIQGMLGNPSQSFARRAAFGAYNSSGEPTALPPTVTEGPTTELGGFDPGPNPHDPRPSGRDPRTPWLPKELANRCEGCPPFYGVSREDIFTWPNGMQQRVQWEALLPLASRTIASGTGGITTYTCHYYGQVTIGLSWSSSQIPMAIDKLYRALVIQQQ